MGFEGSVLLGLGLKAWARGLSWGFTAVVDDVGIRSNPKP